MLIFYEEKTETHAYNVGVKLDEDQILISEWTLSDVLQELYGNSDREHFLIIKRKYAEKLLKACCEGTEQKPPKKEEILSDDKISETLEAVYKGQKGAFDSVRALLDAKEIPYQFQHWGS